MSVGAAGRVADTADYMNADTGPNAADRVGVISHPDRVGTTSYVDAAVAIKWVDAAIGADAVVNVGPAVGVGAVEDVGDQPTQPTIRTSNHKPRHPRPTQYLDT
ncbi:hypothetical protein ACIBCN_44490, partial [Nocardia sp. NPDC051052]|uniref:hypothetical protein n=1 Tax=Nocardia sp. NPDC051052 TaxID=3364322 RepID=UPI00379168A3